MAMTKEERCELAFERRFGQSMLPLYRTTPRQGVVRVRDMETGSWAEYDVTAWRIRRVAEHDAANI